MSRRPISVDIKFEVTALPRNELPLSTSLELPTLWSRARLSYTGFRAFGLFSLTFVAVFI